MILFWCDSIQNMSQDLGILIPQFLRVYLLVRDFKFSMESIYFDELYVWIRFHNKDNTFFHARCR